jgi:negative regulator of sigma E activity
MQISAFVDGELQDLEADLLLRRMSQDVELRAEVAEYLAIGRLIRSEPGLAATDRLHKRITAAIDERPIDTDESVSVAEPSRKIRPLAGVAIAATVALVAIFALQQTTEVDDLSTEGVISVANDAAVGDAVPTVDAQLERQRLYFRNHAETSSELGANGMNTRFVTLRFSEEITEESETDDSAADTPDETTEAPTQP